MKILTKKEALAQGKTRYFTGKSCIKGHIAERQVWSGGCCECQRLAQMARRSSPEGEQVSRAYYKRRRSEVPELLMWQSARGRARKAGVPFSITPDDVLAVWPVNDLCPILGIRMTHNFDGRGGNAPNSPSLDRIKPALGYVRGNIVVISMKANRLKGDETDPEVFMKIANWMKEK